MNPVRNKSFVFISVGALLVFAWIILDWVETLRVTNTATVKPDSGSTDMINYAKTTKEVPSKTRAIRNVTRYNNPHCRFRVPSLNRNIQFTCGKGDFVSVVKSVCKTQLGNQLSSYAAMLYFQVKHGYHAFLDPDQTRAIGQVFKKNQLGIGTFDFYQCGCTPGAQDWIHLLDLHQTTGVATRLTDDPQKYSKNHLLGLGPHSVPLFLIKEVMTEVKQQLVFKDRLIEMATDILKHMKSANENHETIVVGVHARRGDKLRVWRQSDKVLNILGKYEANFFRYSMNLMRKRFNSAGRKVAFIVTSDNYGWTKNKLGNNSDTFFSRDFVNAPVKGPTSLGVDLAVLSLANHTIMDYGTFGLWAGLLAGGTIIAPTGYTKGKAKSPDLVWWSAANMENVELIDIQNMN